MQSVMVVCCVDTCSLLWQCVVQIRTTSYGSVLCRHMQSVMVVCCVDTHNQLWQCVVQIHAVCYDSVLRRYTQSVWQCVVQTHAVYYGSVLCRHMQSLMAVCCVDTGSLLWQCVVQIHAVYRSSVWTAIAPVGIATRYGLDGPGFQFQWGKVSTFPSRPSLGPTQLPIPQVPSLSREYSGSGVALTTHPYLAPRLKKEQPYAFTPPLGLRGPFQVDRLNDCEQ